MKAIVVTPYYDWDGRKYIEVKSEGLGVTRLKVPFRYGRVMCKTQGIKTIQEFKTGDEIEVVIKVAAWDGEEFLVLEEFL